MTSYVTALHILSFAVLRWISIQFPLFYHKIAIRHGNVSLMQGVVYGPGMDFHRLLKIVLAIKVEPTKAVHTPSPDC